MKKMNPKKKPATQYDVERARREGRDEAYKTILAIFLWAWKEKFHASDDDIVKMGDYLRFYAQEIAAGRISARDIMEAMDDEHGWNLEIK